MSALERLISACFDPSVVDSKVYTDRGEILRVKLVFLHSCLRSFLRRSYCSYDDL